MVGLTNTLIKILDTRSSSLTGEDIKNIVDAIAVSESIPDEADKKREKKEQNELNKIIDEWKNGKKV